MFFYQLLALCSSLNHYCEVLDCTLCVQGYPYLKVACVSTCPENSELDLNDKCEVLNFSPFIHLNFFNFLDYGSSTIDDFYHPQSLSFDDSSRLSPIPTKERGFYFTTTSSLKTSKNWVLAPLFMIDLVIRIKDDGSILKIWTTQNTIFHMYSQSGVLYASILLYKDYSPVTKTYSFSYQQGEWINPSFQCKLQSDLTTLKFGSIFSLSNYEFFTFNDLSYILGSSTSSFSGFFYELLISNNENNGIYFNMRPPYCEFNEFYVFFDNDNFYCSPCSSSCPTWPWCTRSTSCVTCFSENCDVCTGFFFESCTSCSNFGPFPRCDIEPNCYISDYDGCFICDDGYFLTSGVCLSIFGYQEGSLEPSIQVKFDTFQENYGIFQSGSISASYSPYNNFEVDDPYPVYNRGMYFSESSYFVSSKLFLLDALLAMRCGFILYTSVLL